MKKRTGSRGSASIETLLGVAILGVGSMIAFIELGTDVHQQYRTSRTTLASPFP